MNVAISLSADEVMRGGDEDTDVIALGFDSLHVSMAGEASCNGDEIAGAESKCKYCGEALREISNPPYDYEAVDPDSVAWSCDCPENTEDAVTASADPDVEVYPHVPEYIPGSFANSARVIISDDDSVTVTISVGDPRGAFAMTVSRNDAGDLFLSVPYEGMGLPHMSLTKLSEGYYRIGG